MTPLVVLIEVSKVSSKLVDDCIAELLKSLWEDVGAWDLPRFEDRPRLKNSRLGED